MAMAGADPFAIMKAMGHTDVNTTMIYYSAESPPAFVGRKIPPVFELIGSSLPQDSWVFQRDRNAVAVRYHSRRIVR